MKKKMTAKQKADKRRRKAETMIIFLNGKQKRVKKPSYYDEQNEFERQNADPLYWHLNEEWENIETEESGKKIILDEHGQIPF